MGFKSKDVAKMMNVSPTTVSLVLNNKPGVGEETRKIISDKIIDMGYGHLLKKNRAYEKNIAFIVYKRHGEIILESPFFSLLIQNIENNVRKNGYKLVIVYLEKSEYTIDEIQHLKHDNCDGLIIFATEMLKDDLLPFYDLKIPFVIIDNDFFDEPIDSVSINNSYGTYEAVKYLVNMGHKTIGYLQSKVFINSFDQRIKGFFSALKQFNIQGMEKYVYKVGYPDKNTYDDFVKIINSKTDLPSALFADNDLIAYGAIKALKEYGYKVPDDISIIGFDDRPICTLIEPNLTTINVPKDIYGNVAVEILINKIENKGFSNNSSSFIKSEIGTSLVERNSVKKISQ